MLTVSLALFVWQNCRHTKNWKKKPNKQTKKKRKKQGKLLEKEEQETKTVTKNWYIFIIYFNIYYLDIFLRLYISTRKTSFTLLDQIFIFLGV